MNASIETGIHRTDAYQYMRAIAEVWSGRWWWTIALPVIVSLSLGMVFNPAFVFVALMLVFLILPLVMMFLYFYYALTPEARMAILKKRLRISPDTGIDVVYEPLDDTDTIPAATHIPWHEVTRVECRDRDMIMHLSGSRYRFMIVPYDAINDADRQKLVSSMTSTIPIR